MSTLRLDGIFEAGYLSPRGNPSSVAHRKGGRLVVCMTYIFITYRIIFITGTGKSHVVQLIERDMTYFLKNILNTDPDQPIVLMTAPTGSAAYQIGGSTIESALLIHDNFNNKPSWFKCNTMQLKLQHTILSLTDEISMVDYQKFQQMNQTICMIKGTHDGN